mgnify:CR=1 FL=1
MKRPWLAPLVPLYAAGAALRARFTTTRRLSRPVISIGNLSMGGSGKTPLAIYLAQQLTARGFVVDVLSRGYGRASSIAAKVQVVGPAKLFGDEPLLIARATGVPVYVAPQRYDAGFLAEGNLQEPESTSLNPDSRAQIAAGTPQEQVDVPPKHSARAHILDDGFQHCQLHRDIDILLLDREDLHDSLLPAGNLREALRAAERADVIAIPADDSTLETDIRARGWKAEIWRIRRHMEIPQVTGPVFAFCGIARPGQFFAGLRNAGVELAETETFRDHHIYSVVDLADLARAAYAYGATALLTTEKDRVRLGSLADSLPHKLPLLAARLTVTLDDEAAVLDRLVAHLPANS